MKTVLVWVGDFLALLKKRRFFLARIKVLKRKYFVDSRYVKQKVTNSYGEFFNILNRRTNCADMFVYKCFMWTIMPSSEYKKVVVEDLYWRGWCFFIAKDKFKTLFTWGKKHRHISHCMFSIVNSKVKWFYVLVLLEAILMPKQKYFWCFNIGLVLSRHSHFSLFDRKASMAMPC